MRRSLIHDRNVRVAPDTRPPGRRTAWRWRLARLLLSRAVGVAGLAALLSSMPACIIPVAPDFQDPDAFPQVAPWIHEPSQPFAQVVSVLGSSREGVIFSVQVTDLNASDKLYARWIVNPPGMGKDPSLETVTLLQGASDEVTDRLLPTVVLVENRIFCGSDTWKSNPLPQQLELVVADGEFTGDLDTVDPMKTRRSYANWTILLECSSTAGASP